MGWLHALKLSIPLPANTADLVNVAFVVTEHVSAVKHYDPGIFGVVLESRA